MGPNFSLFGTCGMSTGAKFMRKQFPSEYFLPIIDLQVSMSLVCKSKFSQLCHSICIICTLVLL